MRGAWSDIRFAMRGLRKNPGFCVTASRMLALGIGVNATIFCWIQTILLNPIPGVSNTRSLVAIVQSEPNHVFVSRVSYPDFKDLSVLNDVFSGVVGTSPGDVILHIGNRTAWVPARLATANIFDILGIKMEKGRGFLPGEDEGEGGHPVLVISHELWQTQFGGDAGIIGRTVRINESLCTIVGVTGASFRDVIGGGKTDVWAPLSMRDAILNYRSYDSRTFRWIQVLARLRAGVSAEKAHAALLAVSKQSQLSYPDSNEGITFESFPLWESPYGGQATFLPLLRILAAVGLSTLLIVAANVSCLVLARGTQRNREVAIRRTLGAGRLRLVRQFLSESLVLALTGACLGLVFAWFAIHAFNRFAPAAGSTFQYDFRVNPQTLVFLLVLVPITALGFGLMPALRSGQTSELDSLNNRTQASLGVRHRRLLNCFLVVEMATTLALLIAAGMCIGGFRRAEQLNLGFNPQHVIYASFDLMAKGFTADQAKSFDKELCRRLTAIPGVGGAAFVNVAPLGGRGLFGGNVYVPGLDAKASQSKVVPFLITSPGYLNVMQIPLLEGRDFTEQDDAGRERVAMVNATMARLYWPGLDPVGRQFRMAVGVADPAVFTVIGVVEGGKYETLSEPQTPLVYVTYLQRPIASLFMNVLVRTEADPNSIVSVLRDEVQRLDPNVDVAGVMPLEDYIQPAFAPGRIAAEILAGLGAAALLLSCFGLYGVTAYTVSQRRFEFAVRLALGAQKGHVWRMVMRESTVLLAISLSGGLLAVSLMSPVLAKYVYGIRPFDPFTFIVTSALLCIVVQLACYVPAVRATQADPAAALRAE